MVKTADSGSGREAKSLLTLRAFVRPSASYMSHASRPDPLSAVLTILPYHPRLLTPSEGRKSKASLA
jgi:hypothetical protein